MGTKLALIGCVVVFLFQIRPAEGAQLRYVRIGEHKSFTRIVFEFRGTPTFEQPVVKGKGEVSVVFVDTTTTLPRQILSETTQRVDTIEFVEQQSHLAVLVAFPFPYFEVKSFALSSPERIVLDVYQLNAPPEGSVFEKPALPEPAVKLLTKAEEEKAPMEHRALPAREEKKEVEEQLIKDSDKPIPGGNQRASKPDQSIAIPPPASGKGLPTNLVTETTDTVSMPEDESPPVSYWYGHVQTYLLGILTVLSVVIVGLLTFIIFQRRRGLRHGYRDGTVDLVLETDENMAAIDANIKDQFRKLDQL